MNKAGGPIADYMTLRLGERHAILAVVLAEALVTYGGVTLSCRADGAGAVPRRPPASPDARRNRPRNLHPHDVGLAAHADRCAARNIPWCQDGDQRP
jgi:hypothetical protein